MAKAYRVKQAVAIPVVVGNDPEGGSEVTTGENFAPGSLVRSEQLTEYHREQAESGHLDHLLEPVDDVDDAELRAASGGESDYGVFIPEHEAERTALMVAGHGVVPKEQELELMSASEQHSSQHMEQVREAGIDRRPVQEHMAQAGQQRVPDHVLTGAETHAGMPHNRGPAEQEHGAEEYDDESDVPTTRPRPSLSSRSELGEDHEANSEDASGSEESANSEESSPKKSASKGKQ